MTRPIFRFQSSADTENCIFTHKLRQYLMPPILIIISADHDSQDDAHTVAAMKCINETTIRLFLYFSWLTCDLATSGDGPPSWRCILFWTGDTKHIAFRDKGMHKATVDLQWPVCSWLRRLTCAHHLMQHVRATVFPLPFSWLYISCFSILMGFTLLYCPETFLAFLFFCSNTHPNACKLMIRPVHNITR